MTKPEDKKKKLGVVVPVGAGIVLVADAEGDKKEKPKMLTFEEVEALSTSELLDVMHSDTGVFEKIDENDFWKVILERKPFWFFDLTRKELGEYNNRHLERHEVMEGEMNRKIEALETALRLLIEMIGDSRVEVSISTVLKLAGFGELCL